jgi:hypothetical protein
MYDTGTSSLNASERSMKQLFAFILLVQFAMTVAAERFTVSGTISDSASGETLPGASVAVEGGTGRGASANLYGYYSLTLQPGSYDLVISYLGYESKRIQVELNKNRVMDIRLDPSSELLEELVVSAAKRNDNIVSDKVGVEQLQIREIKNIPVLFGEQDLLKTLTLTPGVKSIGEGNGGIYVRGGSNAQNLILLDEAMVYNANHLLGFFSTFNSDAIRDLTLYKGTAPAEYGGRLSSVMDVKMNEGNNQTHHLSGGVGLISSRLMVEGPLVKDRGSYLISGRRTYADLFLKLSSDPAINNNQLYFYDFNAKMNFKLNDKNRLYLSAYYGRDIFDFAGRFGMNWGNSTITGRWNRIWSGRTFSNTSFIFSDYDYKVGIDLEPFEFSILSQIKNLNLKHDLQFFMNDKLSWSTGYSGIFHTITPGQVEAPADSEINPIRQEQRYGLEQAVYLSANFKPSSSFVLNAGFRVNSMMMLGPGEFYSYRDGAIADTLTSRRGEIVKHYIMPEPRINLSYIISQQQSLKLSYTRNSQNLHVVSNSTGSLPTDIWLISGKNVRPEISDQVSAGYFRNLGDDVYQLSAETYYKWMHNQIDLRNGADIRANQHIERELLFGKGRAYGLELMLKKKYGVLNGWIGYTLSRTELNIPGINEGNWYPARQDATHDVSVVAIYDVSERWNFSGTWVYRTGNAITFPSGKYEVDGQVQLYYTERNGYRMPAYHRLDLGATYTFRKRGAFESSLNFSVYNAYARKNAFSIDFEQNPDDPTKTQAVLTYLFTIMPSVTYNFKF